MLFLKLCDFFHKYKALYIALWLMILVGIVASTYLSVVLDDTDGLYVIGACLLLIWPLSKVSRLNKSRYS